MKFFTEDDCSVTGYITLEKANRLLEERGVSDEKQDEIERLKHEVNRVLKASVAGTFAGLGIAAEKQSALLDKAVAALEFYANEKNWIYTSYDVCQTITPDDLSTVPTRNPTSSAFGKSTANGYVYECGGKTAKQALEEIKRGRKP